MRNHANVVSRVEDDMNTALAALGLALVGMESADLPPYVVQAMEHRAGIVTMAVAIEETTEVFDGDFTEKTARSLKIWSDTAQGRYRIDIVAHVGVPFREVYCAGCEKDGSFLDYIEFGGAGQPFSLRFGDGRSVTRFFVPLQEFGNFPAPASQLNGVRHGGLVSASFEGSPEPSDGILEDIRNHFAASEAIDWSQCRMLTVAVARNSVGRVVYDLSRGPSVIYADKTVTLDQEGAPDVLVERIINQLSRYDGFWFPSRVRFDRYGDGVLTYRNTSTVTDCVINQDQSRAFTLAGMDVRPGTFVSDNSETGIRVWNGSTLEPYSRPVAAVPVTKLSRGSRAWFIVAANVGVLLVILIVFLWRRSNGSVPDQ